MLVLSGNLLNKQVLSLRTSTPVASVVGFIINPNNLKIEGFYCQDPRKDVLVLVTQDIRETVDDGYIVNDYDALVKPEDLVRLKKTMDIDFNPIGKTVVTESKSRIGKVTDFAADLDSMFIIKLYVGQSLLKSFSGGNLIVERTQIIEITPRKIVVDDLLLGAPAEAKASAA